MTAQVTSDLHAFFLCTAHLVFISKVLNIQLRLIIGFLPFSVCVVLIHGTVVTLYLAVGTLNVSAVIQFSIIMNFKLVTVFLTQYMSLSVCLCVTPFQICVPNGL